MNRNSPLEAKECLLLALVCDIRGFTKLTARTYDYIQSATTPLDRANKLVNKLAGYMEQTRNRTRDLILRDLRNDTIPYAIKSTGDGFLVAVKVDDLPRERPPEDGSNLDQWRKIATKIVKGLVKLVMEAKPQEGSMTFGSATYKFLKEWGVHIGIDRSWDSRRKDEATPFRVAGAIAMGPGFLYRSPEWKRTDPPFEDAYGHPVNLAFRLCDKAGRPPQGDEDEEPSPWILLDRRVSRLLLGTGLKGLKKVPLVSSLSPFKKSFELRGIEENWCYALKVKTRPAARSARTRA